MIGCETSGIVREAFRAKGHDAWSCDFLPPDDGCLFHFRKDVREVLDMGWDLAIFHPTCTYLTVSANKWFRDDVTASSGILTGEARREARREAVEFVKMLWECGIPRIAIENPIGALSSMWRKPSQVIHPYQYGHGERKATCLWLKNLPLLNSTNIVEGREQRIWKMPPGPERWKERSKTFQGIGDAFADQWNF